MNRRAIGRILILLALYLPSAPAALAEPAGPLRVVQHPDGLLLEWRGEVVAAPSGAPRIDGWPPVALGGALLPAQLVAVRLPDDLPLELRLTHLTSRPWSGSIPYIDINKQVFSGPKLNEQRVSPQSGRPFSDIDINNRSSFAGAQRRMLPAAPDRALPAAPIVVLREGRMRGERIVVLALSPIFEQAGQVRVATSVRAVIGGAVALTPPPPFDGVYTERSRSAQGRPLPLRQARGSRGTANTAWTHLAPIQKTSLLRVSASPREDRKGFSDRHLDVSVPPRNPAAARPSFTVLVEQAGIQRVTGAALAQAGLDLGALDPTRLHLRVGGVEVALETRGIGDGRLDPADELRFYAPPPGDRWNMAARYWLTVETTPGLRIATRSVVPRQAPLRATALELGSWRQNRIYDSTQPGPWGDHWYAADLSAGPGQPEASFSATLTPTLPLATGVTTLTIAGSAYTPGRHRLSVAMGAAEQTVVWDGLGSWTRTARLDATIPQVRLTVRSSAEPDGIEIAGIAWERPVALDFGGSGAAFAGVAGVWQYQLRNTPAGRALYAIDDPRAPVLLAIPPGASTTFEDGPAPHRYILSGPGTLHTPAITAHTPVNLAGPGADVVYIAPSALHGALAPLLARRAAQGYAARAVDVQAIYDAWSYGQVAPDAIRDFLRYAVSNWSPAPRAAVLVGDGTWDPHNFTHSDNPTLIPPYLAMVDPWMGETACEFCYAQLDGDSPLDDPLPDIMLGRLPVKSAAELSALVSKIVGYETGQLDIISASRMIALADNYRDAEGIADPAGDFAALSEEIVGLQPAGMAIERVYYDPSPGREQGPGREGNAARAYARTMAALNAGAGIVTYVGHSHQWQWALTDPAAAKPYLLGLYDVDLLANGARLPIVLSLTCLTSAFQTAAFGGTTIDERLLLHRRGGAVAVWGPTGMGVAYGHDLLARGFFEALWDAPPQRASLGSLVRAGYLELFTQGGCCQDTLRTYALLGDPLTPARVLPARRVYAPVVRR